MQAQKALAARGNGIRLASHHTHIQRPLLEGSHHIFNEACLANAVIQANLMAVRTKRLLVALGRALFFFCNHLQVLAKLPGKTQDLVLGVSALA